MSTSKTKKTAGKVIAGILIVLVLVAVTGVIVKFTGGLTSDFKTFYVTIGEVDVITTASGYALTKDSPLEVATKYTFGDAGGEANGYSVKVLPNPIDGKDFDFTLDGAYYSYQAETDLTGGFDIEYGEDSFTIAPKGGVIDILQAVYPSSEVALAEGAKTYENMFAMVVSSYNGASSVTIYFHIEEPVTGVTLDRGVICF